MTPAAHARFLRAARRRAPKHPAGPEAILRLATARLLRAQHARIRAAVLRHVAARPKRHDADAPDPLDATDRSVFAALWNESRHLLRTSPFHRIVDVAAKRTARSANEQTAKALDLDDHDPPLPTDDLTGAITDGMGDFLDDGIDRAADALAEWDDLGEDSPRAGDEDALGGMLDDAMNAAAGAALAWIAMRFARGFAEFIAGSQEAAGVSQAVWMSTLDSHVRPAHAALDNVVFSWDDPPLKASESDNGEDCFPGDDFGCRCVSSPIPPDGGFQG